jgi:AcrR family transcriptional regulator
MPRVALSPDQVEDFRMTLCEAATQLFAEHGYEGVTLRALAKTLSCSPMTPYRYFANKAEIFTAVRTAAADRFGYAIEAAVRAHKDHHSRLSAMCRAYVDFAVAEPHAYRIMFEIDRNLRGTNESNSDIRGWWVMHTAVSEAIHEGALTGEPNVVAHLLWSGVHGIVALHLSGMLALGLELDALVEAFIDRELGRGAFHNPRLSPL